MSNNVLHFAALVKSLFVKLGEEKRQPSALRYGSGGFEAIAC